MHHAAAGIGVIAAGLALPACAQPAAYDVTFVSEFAEACVPGRLTYAATKQAVVDNGWEAVAPSVNPELAAMMVLSEAAAEDPELQATFEYQTYSKQIAGQAHFLVASRASAMIGDPDDPEDTLNPWVSVGCYLYNLDAEAAIDPEPVTALVGNPISNSHTDDSLVGYVWGPPCPMPRTGDTYLTFIPEGSSYVDQTGFSGLVLKFDTSELDPGAAVPDPYC
ncbi:hypothetical protein [Devosia sp.]|uniref:hypothetical protein n=1 Tax=Devosia sp. TaxID=1871048 RepID=UPI003A928D8D